MLIYTNGTSDLDGIIAPLPWRSEFLAGSGVNAIRGKVTGSALKGATLNPVTAQRYTISTTYISSESDYRSVIDAGAAGSHNTGGATIAGSTSYLRKVRYSSTSLTVLVQSS